MRRYFKNLLMALLGRNPYQMELYEVRYNYGVVEEHVRILNDMYYKAVEKMVKTEKWITDYQTIVENLRERIKEKEAELESQDQSWRDRMEGMKAVYEHRLNDKGLTTIPRN